jgi:hypothetical protein
MKARPPARARDSCCIEVSLGCVSNLSLRTAGRRGGLRCNRDAGQVWVTGPIRNYVSGALDTIRQAPYLKRI